MSGKYESRMCADVNSRPNLNPIMAGNIRDIRNSDNTRSPVIRLTRKLVQVSRKTCATAVGGNNIWRTSQTVRQEVRLVEKKGHYDVVCRSGRKVQQVHCPNYYGADVHVLCSKGKHSKKCVKCAVSVNSVDMTLFVDTAPDVSLMSLQLFYSYLTNTLLEKH